MSTTLSSSSLLASVSDELAGAVERAGAGVVTVDARRRHPASGIVWSSRRADRHRQPRRGARRRDRDRSPRRPRPSAPRSSVATRQRSRPACASTPPTSTPLERSAVEPRVGHLALAIGRPGPSGAMASLGVISAVGGPLRFRGGASLERYVRADVAMLPGFSGGPLVDSAGSLIGLNSSTLGRAGQLTVLAESIDATVGDAAAARSGAPRVSWRRRTGRSAAGGAGPRTRQWSGAGPAHRLRRGRRSRGRGRV